MKIFFSILFAITLSVFQSYNLTDIRKMYVESSDSKVNATKFYDFMNKYSKNDETLLAYKGASIALKSKHTSGLKQKKEGFIKGVSILEGVIKANPNNVEARLIRLSIQENTPKLLKYKENIEADKKQILLLFNKQSADLKEYIKKYVNQSLGFTKAEKQQLNK
ncbi:hypothetical protein G6N05_02370 [Flavobacterium sp. F372]|uniref:DUF4142 domain-containing protein n=1 Tax=Flavobacterium bernardetii TaxID=2813823 RepID=A0ABR7IVD4_9FLAO|nr:hypothetical protein [Flavobacterium bernardetii]MBC5833722.1 hypothetical protein [Flavobacterium bernardetii]NHF68955.1 hypothetical protein [Flavobacterium bernardetii]